jgi:copper chaperone CopZ
MKEIYRNLILFFRKKYISSLIKYDISVNPKYITEETKDLLTQEFKDMLEIHTVLFNKNISDLNKRKIDWSKEIDTKLLSMGAKNEIEKINKSIKKVEGGNTLYTVNFDTALSAKEAKIEIQKLGLMPANFIETIIFIQEYASSLQKLPIITIDGFFDYSKKIKILKSDTYSICYSGVTYEWDMSGFVRIGELENSDFLLGTKFRKGTLFLVKEI